MKTSLIPKPSRSEIQIKFHACSLNYRDLILSKGLYQASIKFRVVPISDGAGEVTAVGTGPSASGLEVIMGTLGKNACIRGISIGSVQQFNTMNDAIEMHKIKPIIDKIFEFEDLKSAYEYQWSQKHIGKIVVKIPQ
ncbi:hypothetical protein I4U23_011346 [Adineta vaga]|nr:hypothetical protein I4U23_011346 [Adineta vaga]